MSSKTETVQKKTLFPPHPVKRWIILCFGLALMALGISFSIKADLGTSPVASFPYVLSLIAPITVGTATILMHCACILLQILILRKRYQPIQLLQLAIAILFGYMQDFFVWLIQGLSYSAYWQQWVYCVIGIVLVAFGVSLEVLSRVVPIAGEGFVLAVCQVLPIKFGYMKMIFDISLVVIACVISLIFLGGIYGVREGTVAAAVFVGLLSKQMQKPLTKLERKYLA